MRSFGEKELYVQASATGMISQTGLSSSDGNATTPTPCVTPQPALSRSEDTVILKVHGISEAGTVLLKYVKCIVITTTTTAAVTTTITTTTTYYYHHCTQLFIRLNGCVLSCF